jgi:hypothetical protein
MMIMRIGMSARPEQHVSSVSMMTTTMIATTFLSQSSSHPRIRFSSYLSAGGDLRDDRVMRGASCWPWDVHVCI